MLVFIRNHNSWFWMLNVEQWQNNCKTIKNNSATSSNVGVFWDKIQSAGWQVQNVYLKKQWIIYFVQNTVSGVFI